jgi:hypothetical protein
MMVTIAGPANVQNPTNSAGCAIFAYVPIGSYTASVNSAGWVDKGGNQLATVGATVSQGTVSVRTLLYDKAASVDATFDTEDRNGNTTVIPAPTTTRLSASNSGVPTGPNSSAAGARMWDPPGGAVGTITASGLYPFPDGYGLYGGGCRGADPTVNDSDYYSVFPGAFTDVSPGLASPPVKVRLPSINLRVLYNGSPMAETYRQTTRILVTSTQTGCTGTQMFQVDRPAPATEAAPPTPVGATPTGYMTDSALPFGTYKVCVQSRTPGSPSSTRYEELTGVRNWYHRGMKLPDIASPVIDLVSGTSGGTCS